MLWKVLIFSGGAIVSAVVSVWLLIVAGFITLPELVVTLAPEGSIMRSLVPENVRFQAEQLENTRRAQERAPETE